MNPTNEPHPAGGDADRSGAEIDIDLRGIWRVLVKRRRLEALVFGVVLLSVAIVTFAMKPVYKGTTQILIERKSPAVLPFQDVSPADTSNDWKSAETYYQTQLKLLQSRTVATRVLDGLKLRESEEFETITKQIARGNLKGEPDVRYTEAFLENVDIQQVKNSRLFDVSYLSHDAQRSSDISNALAEAYIVLNNEVTSNTSETATKSLRDQIKDLQDEVRKRETAVQVYAREQNLVYIDIDNRQDVALIGLKEINQNYNTAKVDRIAKEVHYQAMKGAVPESLPEVINNPLVAELKADYSKLSQQYSQMASKFGPEWPPMKEFKTRFEEARQRLDVAVRDVANAVLRSAEVEYHKSFEREQGLKRAIERQTTEAQTSDMAAILYRTMRADLDTRKATLDAMMKRAGEAGISAGVEPTAGSNVRIIDRSIVPTKPYKPKKLLNLILGAILGTLCAVAGAFFMEYLDNTIKTAEEVTQITRVPVLAQIPYWAAAALGPERTTRADRIAVLEPTSTAAEAFRELRTALLLSNPDRPPRGIILTSALPEEGKTIVAANLAAALARAGKRVLLVDCDLRRPRMHRALGLGNALGMGNILAGTHPIDAVLQKGGIPGLDVITSGPLPPNPSELLGSAAFRTLLLDFEKRGYDHLIFDSGPALSVVDPIILATQVQGAVLVLRAGVTPREAAREVCRKLANANAHLLGCVLNGITADHGSSYHYRYDYAAPAAAPDPTPPVTSPPVTRIAERREKIGGR